MRSDESSRKIKLPAMRLPSLRWNSSSFFPSEISMNFMAMAERSTTAATVIQLNRKEVASSTEPITRGPREYPAPMMMGRIELIRPRWEAGV